MTPLRVVWSDRGSADGSAPPWWPPAVDIAIDDFADGRPHNRAWTSVRYVSDGPDGELSVVIVTQEPTASSPRFRAILRFITDAGVDALLVTSIERL